MTVSYDCVCMCVWVFVCVCLGVCLCIGEEEGGDCKSFVHNNNYNLTSHYGVIKLSYRLHADYSNKSSQNEGQRTGNGSRQAFQTLCPTPSQSSPHSLPNIYIHILCFAPAALLTKSYAYF